eukprot:Tamp_09418.p4 GENE.Tamp_09418~~Tamp_09418.p4  ORF type:complete len:126 (+),score=34.00 Tamp_09418:249-626(+)
MCASGSGCPVQEASGAVECVCAGAVPAPPPPIPGSDEWLQSDEHALVAPGPEAASAGLDMAMYEAGHAAVHLADYLKHKAETEETKAELAKLVLYCLKQAQPCELVLAESGVVKCKAGTGVAAAA